MEKKNRFFCKEYSTRRNSLSQWRRSVHTFGGGKREITFEEGEKWPREQGESFRRKSV